MSEIYGKIIVSSCLLGGRVRYDGSIPVFKNKILSQWLDQGIVVPFCPEIAGGLKVPRAPAEVSDGDGFSVLSGEAGIYTNNGEDVTNQFKCGAYETLVKARECRVSIAILKDGSPSCGSSYIYDGSFSKTKKPGMGVTTALLEKNGILVFSEHKIEEAAFSPLKGTKIDYLSNIPRLNQSY